MKIVQVQTQAEAAGAQRVSDMVGQGLRARGHEVRTVFMYRKTNAYDADPYADFILRERPNGPLDYLKAIWGLIGYMRRASPQAVISYQHYGNIAGTLAGRLAGVRRLVTNQSGAPGRHGGRLAAIADTLMGELGAYRFSIVNSRWTEQQFAAHPSRYRRRLRRIDHGVARPQDPPDRAAARAAFGLPPELYLAVSTGRLTEQKNQIALIEATAGVPDMHLALAGTGPAAEALTSRAHALGMGNRLHMVGELPPERVFQFLAAGDVFLFASRSETFGLSVAEAAIAGLPIVSNDLGVLREVLGDAAIFVDADKPDQFVEGIHRIRTVPSLAEQLRAQGSLVAERYRPETMCASYEALLVG
jgi:glycosyltransferase involved in cell wall biosynthesis